MITRSSIAFEDFVGSSIAPQVMPPWRAQKCNNLELAMPSSFTIFAFMFTISLQILTFQYSGQHTVSILVYRMVSSDNESSK